MPRRIRSPFDIPYPNYLKGTLTTHLLLAFILTVWIFIASVLIRFRAISPVTFALDSLCLPGLEGSGSRV